MTREADNWQPNDRKWFWLDGIESCCVGVEGSSKSMCVRRFSPPALSRFCFHLSPFPPETPDTQAKLFKACKTIRSLTWDTDNFFLQPCGHVRQMTIWHSTMKYILCSVREGSNGVDFRPESRLMTLRDVKQKNYVKCIKYKSIF